MYIFSKCVSLSIDTYYRGKEFGEISLKWHTCQPVADEKSIDYICLDPALRLIIYADARKIIFRVCKLKIRSMNGKPLFSFVKAFFKKLSEVLLCFYESNM